MKVDPQHRGQGDVIFRLFCSEDQIPRIEEDPQMAMIVDNQTTEKHVCLED